MVDLRAMFAGRKRLYVATLSASDQRPIYGACRGTKLSGMKKIVYLSSSVIVIALSVAIFSGCGTTGSSSNATTTTTANANSGRLVINRAANMGSALFLNVSIDGKHVGSYGEGQSYNGFLSEGPHLVSVVLEPNQLNLTPTQKRITVTKGHTYTFTAMWQGDSVVLL
jgi:hypothetical protein